MSAERRRSRSLDVEMSGTTGRQFRLVAEIADALGGAGIAFWLRGGWALDFLLGEMRTAHADIDLVAWRRDRDRIYEALASRGFEYDRELRDAAIDFEKNGESIQILLVEFSSSGALVCHGFESSPFPERSLDGPVCELEGVSCRMLAPHALLHEKQTYELRRGRPLREKDRASIILLRQLMDAD
jgi:hypothetical protein